jgi:hypothetical protein
MGRIVSMPRATTAGFTSRELNRFVIEALRAIEVAGGDQAFDRATRDLVVSTIAVFSHVRGHRAAADLLKLIESVLSK